MSDCKQRNADTALLILMLGLFMLFAGLWMERADKKLERIETSLGIAQEPTK